MCPENSKAVGKPTGTKFKPLPKFFESVLQGLAYWIGYERSYYTNYHIAESAVVHEAAKLFSVHIDSEQKVFCEIPYSAIKPEITPTKGTLGKHADILIAKGKVTEDCYDFSSVDFLFEVKRYVKSYGSIVKDIDKLCEYFNEAASLRCARAFLLVVSEHKLPEMFAEIYHHDADYDTVGAKRQIYPVLNKNGFYFKVRRVCKALHSQSHLESAHYICAI